MSSRDTLYDRVLGDETVAGGPVEYGGDDVRSAHDHLDLEQEHFDAIAAHLEAALRDFDVSDAGVEAISIEVAALEDDVLGRRPGGNASSRGTSRRADDATTQTDR